MHHLTMTALVNERRATLLHDGELVRRARRTRRGRAALEGTRAAAGDTR